MSHDMGTFIVLDLPPSTPFCYGGGLKPQICRKVLKITLIICESLTSLDRGIFTGPPVYSGSLILSSERNPHYLRMMQIFVGTLQG